MIRILVVDDETRFARALAISLRARDYAVDVAVSGEDGLALAASVHPDVIVLDLGLPNLDGLDVLRALRAWTAVPVIVLSARDQDASKVEALDLGADDYVTKPFSMDELLARIRAALRRATKADDSPTIANEHFSIDLAAKQITDATGALVHLTPTEWHVLEMLVRHRGKLVTQRQLLQEVWGPQYETETDYLRVYMAALRRKLEPEPSAPRYFITEPGMGYRFAS
jgi:two-component system, OmpR family, KDP operon response regulator KdpE